jgi:hypothetical protein
MSIWRVGLRSLTFFLTWYPEAETTIAQNKRAIELLRKNGIVSEAQFIVGLENETPETLEETFRTFKVRKDPACPACGEDAPPPVLADYCAACGAKAPTGDLVGGLEGGGWLRLPSRRLHPDQRAATAPHNCLCPACLSTPTRFTLQLLRAWGLPIGVPDAEPRRSSWPQSQT